MAVLPTPGSPMRTGLFLVRRDSTWMTRRISSSRPMTGSILPLAGDLGEVAAVLLERLELLLGVLAGDPVAAPHGLQGRQQVLAGDAEPVGQGEQQVLGRQVLVVQLGAGRVGVVEHPVEVTGQPRLAAVGVRQLGERLVHLVAQGQRRLAEPLEDRQDDALVLAQQGEQQVVGRDLGVGGGLGGIDGRVEGLLDLQGPAVGVERHAAQDTTRSPNLIVRHSSSDRPTRFVPGTGRQNDHFGGQNAGLPQFLAGGATSQSASGSPSSSAQRGRRPRRPLPLSCSTGPLWWRARALEVVS